MRTLILTALLTLGGAASAATDYACVSSCTAQGMNYGLCVNRCSYDTAPVQQTFQPLKQTDYACVNQCTAAGLAYGLCQAKCSY